MIARTVSTLIVKPTKFCNAQCSYCSAPPEVNGASKWSIETFKRRFDVVAPALARRALVLFHGGEPMLMGPDFYREAAAHVRQSLPEVGFSIQTNALLYRTDKWRDVVGEVFRGSLSTSFDPDETHRHYKDSTARYTAMFMRSLDDLLSDGFRPTVIGTYTDETADLAHRMYEFSVAKGPAAPSLRFNYRYPAGRDAGKGALISPERYGEMLLDLYDRWVVDCPSFRITPLDQMLLKVAGAESNRCPWTNRCGGHFLAIEPNGDAYNCSEFADLADEAYRFGNVDVDDVQSILTSPSAKAMRRRVHDVPQSCLACRHFQECEGGCARDSVLFGRGMGGKFFYCASWMAVFDRIKASVRSGEADRLLVSLGVDPEVAKAAAGFVRVPAMASFLAGALS